MRWVGSRSIIYDTLSREKSYFAVDNYSHPRYIVMGAAHSRTTSTLTYKFGNVILVLEGVTLRAVRQRGHLNDGPRISMGREQP
jgi:hypothetical protein